MRLLSSGNHLRRHLPIDSHLLTLRKKVSCTHKSQIVQKCSRVSFASQL